MTVSKYAQLKLHWSIWITCHSFVESLQCLIPTSGTLGKPGIYDLKKFIRKSIGDTIGIYFENVTAILQHSKNNNLRFLYHILWRPLLMLHVRPHKYPADKYWWNPANILMSDQRCFNIVNQHWNYVDPTLKVKQNPKSVFQRCTTLYQRCFNVASRLLKLYRKQSDYWLWICE